MDKFLELQNQHQYEQMMAGMRQLAAIVHGYYEHLVEQGCSKQRALALTIAFQAEIIRNSKSEQEGT